MIRAVRAAGLAALIAGSAASSALAHHRHREPDRRHHHPQRGIDVSHYQGHIDWPAVAGDHVSFAYIKATEGVGGRDAWFARNWEGARRAGIRVGAYHYFIFCRSPRAQADNFLQMAPRTAGALPPAVDLESASGCHGRLTGAEMRRDLDAYLARVEGRQRARAVLYVTPSFYATYRAYLPSRAMWRRSVRSRPASNAAWAFWQYGSRGHVHGIQTLVDLNLSAGPAVR